MTTVSSPLDDQGFDIEFQDVEYIKIAGDALEEAIEIANSTDGWKEEKKDDKTVS